MSSEVFNKIKNCNKSCKYGKMPFLFPIKNQEVMLLTTCPSIQAMFRPITSIRFFRNVCIALFGDANISVKYIEALHDKIYWTHYKKCYSEDVIEDFDKVDNTCFNSFFQEELSTLNPKVIIVLGKSVAEKEFGDELKLKGCTEFSELKEKCFKIEKWGKEIYITDFPETGSEERFNIIRNRLFSMSSFKNVMMKNKNGKWINEDIRYFADYKKRNITHIEYEWKCLEKHMENKNIESKQIEYIWYKNVTEPNMNNYHKITQYAFFTEDQIKTILYDIASKPHIRAIINEGNNVFDVVDYQWIKSFKVFLSYLTDRREIIVYKGEKINKDQIELIITKIYEIKKIRDKIVHSSGYVEPKMTYDNQKGYFIGIRFFVNWLYISEEGVQEIKNFTESIVELLKEIDRKISL